MTLDSSSSETAVLKLTIGERTWTFPSPAEFEFALSGRVSVPAEKINALVDVSDDDLLKEATAIKQAEQRFADALSGVLANIDDINAVLKETNLSVISHDNDWRAIIAALMAVPAGFEHYKKVALVKYMQYMVSRQEIVKGLYHHRQIHKQASSKAPSTKKSPDKSLGETGIFEYMAFAEPAEGNDCFKRLPKGETLEVELDDDSTFHVRLARSACEIVNRGHLIFVDNNGLETSLREGENIIGRDAAADVVLDLNLRDISRRHLVVEAVGSNVFRLTDVSTHGTWVDPRYVDDTGT